MQPPTPARGKARLNRWLLASVPVIMLLMFVLPFTVFSTINAWYGSFLFWIVSTLVVLGIVAYLSFQWED